MHIYTLSACAWMASKDTYAQQAWFCQNVSAYKVWYINTHAHVYVAVYVKAFLGHTFQWIYKYGCLLFRLLIVFTNARLLGDISAWRYAREHISWPACLCARLSVHTHQPAHLWSSEWRHSGARQQDAELGRVAHCLICACFRERF